MTKPKDSSSEGTAKAAAPKKAASTTPVVPNVPKPVDTPDDKAKVAPKPAIDSALVGAPQGQPRDAAARKETVAPATKDAAAPLAAAAADVTDKPAAVTTPIAKPESSTETRIVEVRKAGFMPMLLGGVVAAGLGAAATWWAIPQLPEGWRPVSAPATDPQAQIAAARAAGAEAARSEIATSRATLIQDATKAATDAASTAGETAVREALNAAMSAAPTEAEAAAPVDAPTIDLSAIESQLQAQNQRIEGLDAALSALNTPAAPALETPGQGASTAGLAEAEPRAVLALQSALAQLKSRVDAQDQQLADLAARPTADPQAAARLEELRQQAEATQQAITAAAAEAEQRIASAQSEAAAVQEQTAQIGRRAQISTAVAGLQAALETGGSLEGGIADLTAGGIDLPEALAADVPSLIQLQADFDAASRAGLNAALKAESQGEGAMGAIGNFLRVQTGARSIEPREGDDPDAVLSRAADAVRRGNIQSALDDIATLPTAGQDAMSGWTADARRWAAARAALGELSASVK